MTVDVRPGVTVCVGVHDSETVGEVDCESERGGEVVRACERTVVCDEDWLAEIDGLALPVEVKVGSCVYVTLAV